VGMRREYGLKRGLRGKLRNLCLTNVELIIPSFKFSILLPATLATHDHHTFGRISYILTARVEGIPSTSITKNLFRTEAPAISAAIPFKEDFETVIARSDKLVQDTTSQRLSSRRQSSSSALAPPMRSLALSDETSPDDSALAFGEGSPLLSGLYHRRQSSDIQNIPPLALGSSTIADDARSIHSVRSSAGESSARSEKTGWLKGDLLTTRSLIIHANPSPSGGVTDLDLRKEGYVAGLGSWRFTATSDVVRL